MLEYLQQVGPSWYPGRQVRFYGYREYEDFDPMLKRDMLYAGFNVLTPVVALHGETDGKRHFVKFTYNNIFPKPPIGFSGFLKEQGILADLHDVSTQYIYMPGDPMDYTCDFVNDGTAFKCSFKEGNDNLLEISLPASSVDTKDGISLETIKNRVIQHLCAWFGSGRTLSFETEKEGAGVWVLSVSEKISSIGIDASMEPEHQVFRWQEDTFRKECQACPPIDSAQAISIVAGSGIAIPPEMLLIGLHTASPEETVPCYIMRYEHRLQDTTDDFKKDKQLFGEAVPSQYANAGTIMVEGDFFVLYLDSAKKRVIGGHRKWRPVAHLLT